MKTHTKETRRFLKTVLFLFVTGTVLLLIYLSLVVSMAISDLPQRVQTFKTNHNETYTPLSHISTYTLDAAIASQDKRFYTNLGIDIIGTARALFYSAISRRRQGASTITEQLAKNAYFHDTDNLQTDIETKLYALFITARYSKNHILAMYLNVIYFGKSAYGISEAASSYFHTTPQRLSLAQSAYIIGLINAPSYLSDHTGKAIQEAQIVLEEMQRDQFITKQQDEQAEKNL